MASVSRKAKFKEIARRIVSDDRSARKHGLAQNTTGAIERALMAAFKEGQTAGPNADADQVRAPHDPVPWEEIPPTSRRVLDDLTFSYSSRHRTPTFEAEELISYQHLGRDRWLPSRSEERVDNLISGKGVNPLVRMGLLEVNPTDPTRLRLSKLGDLTARAYWLRADKDDPTLPRWT